MQNPFYADDHPDPALYCLHHPGNHQLATFYQVSPPFCRTGLDLLQADCQLIEQGEAFGFAGVRCCVLFNKVLDRRQFLTTVRAALQMAANLIGLSHRNMVPVKLLEQIGRRAFRAIKRLLQLRAP